jgi:hypothetical protein
VRLYILFSQIEPPPYKFLDPPLEGYSMWDSVWFFIKEFDCSSVSKASPDGILHKTVYAFLIGTLIGIVHL